jgi:hypothetical protein
MLYTNLGDWYPAELTKVQVVWRGVGIALDAEYVPGSGSLDTVLTTPRAEYPPSETGLVYPALTLISQRP